MNILSKLLDTLTQSTGNATLSAAEYKERFVDANVAHQLVDVRTPAEFQARHIAGADNLPLDQLNQKVGKLPKDKPIILYCRSGNRSGMALNQLRAVGFTDVYNVGSLTSLEKQGLPVK